MMVDNIPNERTIEIIRTLLQFESDCEAADYFSRLKESEPDAAGLLAKLLERLTGDSCTTCREGKAIESMDDGIVLVDSSGKISLMNPAARKILDVKKRNVVGLLPENAGLHDEAVRLFARKTSGKKGDEWDSEIVFSEWPKRTVGMKLKILAAGNGLEKCKMLIIRDLTDIKNYELSQKEFASNVSHELRTPITAVRTTAEALLGGAKDDKQLVDRFLNNIISESDRLTLLIDDLMEIAKIEMGAHKTQKKDADMRDIIERATQVVRPMAREKSILISVEAKDKILCYCDEIQIVHAVRNLIDNAVKYTPEGGKVHVVCEENNGIIEVRVSDTGIGISERNAQRIFDRFYRVDKARSRDMGGTGLGLAIAKDFVNFHGGSIRVESELGRGSTFIISLPRKIKGNKTVE